MQFENRFATLTSVLNDSRSDLDAALSDLSVAVGEVHRFVAGTRDQASEQIRSLAAVTQNLADHRIDLENVLHIAPISFSNFYNIYNPDSGSNVGGFVLNNLSNPVGFVCAAIGAIENVTSPETAKLCAQYLGPALRLLNFNYEPLPINPFLAPAPTRVLYPDERLAPGGEGPRPMPPECRRPSPPTPACRAITRPRRRRRRHRHAYPGISNPAPTTPATPPPPTSPAPMTLPDLLLPAERPPS